MQRILTEFKWRGKFYELLGIVVNELQRYTLY